MMCFPSRPRLLLQVRRDLGELGEGGLEVFDNGDRGSGRHGQEARRMSDWDSANQLRRDHFFRSCAIAANC